MLPHVFISVLSPELSPAWSTNLFRIEWSYVTDWKYMPGKKIFLRDDDDLVVFKVNETSSCLFWAACGSLCVCEAEAFISGKDLLVDDIF